MRISAALCTLLLVLLPLLASCQPFGGPGRKRGKKREYKLGLKSPLFYRKLMPVVADKGKAKEAYRRSPTDVNNKHISYILEGKTFKLVSLMKKDALVYERALKGEDYQGFRDMVHLKNNMSMIVLQVESSLRFQNIILDDQMRVFREFPEMFSSELQLHNGTVLQRDSSQRLTVYSQDMKTSEAFQLPGGNMIVIPQVERLGGKYGVFYFDQNYVLHVSVFEKLVDLATATPERIQTFETVQHPVVLKVITWKSKVFVAVIRKDGQVELSSFHIVPDSLELTYDKQHVLAMKVSKPLATSVELRMVRGESLLLVTGGSKVLASGYDTELNTVFPEKCLCEEMDCMTSHPSDRIQFSVMEDSISMSCLLRTDSDIQLDKVYFFQNEGKEKKSVMGRVFFLLIVIMLFLLVVLVLVYSYMKQRGRKQTQEMTSVPQEGYDQVISNASVQQLQEVSHLTGRDEFEKYEHVNPVFGNFANKVDDLEKDVPAIKPEGTEQYQNIYDDSKQEEEEESNELRL